MTRSTAAAFAGLLVLATSACGGSPDDEESSEAIDQASKDTGGGVPVLPATCGHATFTDGTRATVHMKIRADQHRDGSFKGKQRWNSTGTPASWRGDDPICYTVRESKDGMVAAFAGPITSASDPALIGQYYVIEVLDTQVKEVPDRIGVKIVLKTPDCQDLPVALHPITKGNLTVH
jgi:hypothetical protein